MLHLWHKVANDDIHKVPKEMKIKLAQSHHLVLLTGLNYWKNWSLQEEGRCLGFLVGWAQWVSKHWEGLTLLIFLWHLVVLDFSVFWVSFLFKGPLILLISDDSLYFELTIFYFFSSDHWTSTSKSFRKSQNSNTKWRSLSHAITQLTEKIDSINRLMLT